MHQILIDSKKIAEIRDALQVIQGNAKSAYTRGSHTDEIIKQAEGIDKLLLQEESVKEDCQITMESMESMLDVLDEYIEKADEGVVKLKAASREGGKFRDKLEELREEIKDEWSAL